MWAQYLLSIVNWDQLSSVLVLSASKEFLAALFAVSVGLLGLHISVLCNFCFYLSTIIVFRDCWSEFNRFSSSSAFGRVTFFARKSLFFLFSPSLCEKHLGNFFWACESVINFYEYNYFFAELLLLKIFLDLVNRADHFLFFLPLLCSPNTRFSI